MMMGCRYPSITEIAAEDRIALNWQLFKISQ
jgi:hypothetical protein